MVTLSDFFCGAGGSSTGAVAAGAEVRVAVNHWKRALETHNTNHPKTDHYQDDIQITHPSRYPKTDILWISPECQKHSKARGKKLIGIHQMDLWGNNQVDPADERSRATMREVIDLAEYHRYPIVIVENVIDIKYWQHYESWLTAMENLGYEHRTLYLNAQFFGVPQSRDRWYTIFHRKGNRAPNLDFHPVAHCAKCNRTVSAVQAWKKPAKLWGSYGDKNQYVYKCPTCATKVRPDMVPAANIIDWSLPAEIIGNRKKPLRPATMERIRKGIRKFARPMVLDTAYSHDNSPGKVRPVDEPLATQTARQTFGIAVPPFVMSYYGRNNAQSSLDTPIPTIPTENRHSLVVPPFLAMLRNNSQATNLDDPVATITAGARHHALITPPFITSYNGNGAGNHEIDTPLAAITTVDRHALVVPELAATDVEEILMGSSFRMLQPHELALGMSFPSDYVILGNQREQVKQIGNAVACNVAQWIVGRCVEALQ